MKAIFFTIVLGICTLWVTAQEKPEQKLFKGGMMLHTSYLQTADIEREVSGIGYGLGGQMTFYLSPRFRLGAEGFTSTKNRPNDLGFYKMSWGGVTFNYELGKGKTRVVPGVVAGGGKIRDLFMITGSSADHLPDEIVYLVFSDFLLYPSLAVEFSLKAKLTPLVRVDWVMPIFSDNPNDFAYGPRFYVGMFFNR